MKKIILLTAVLIYGTTFSQITIDETLTPQQLVEDVLIGNPNFPSSNYQLSTGSNFGDVNGVGAFNTNATDFPFSGIVLTTGDIMNAVGPNTGLSLSGGSDGWPGDLDLMDATGVANTFNASTIQFDFVPVVSMISLDFLMASEEYNQSFECTFADTFAFILTNNSTGISENIALIPETATPIQVTTVHPEVAGQCSAINEAYFDKYNFEPFNIASESLIEYNGQTKTFMILGELEVGTSYTLKIVIADAVDTVFDSALFVKGGSFGAFPVIEDEPEDLLNIDDDGDGFSIFDLTVNEVQMLGAIDTSIYSFNFNYYTTQEDADLNENPILTPELYTNESNPQTIFVRMSNAYTGAYITTSFEIEVTTELSISETNFDTLKLVPNPASHLLFVSGENVSEVDAIEIYSINGALIFKDYDLEGDSIQLDISELSNGIYLVKISSKTGTVTRQLVKQ